MRLRQRRSQARKAGPSLRIAADSRSVRCAICQPSTVPGQGADPVHQRGRRRAFPTHVRSGYRSRVSRSVSSCARVHLMRNYLECLVPRSSRSSPVGTSAAWSNEQRRSAPPFATWHSALACRPHRCRGRLMATRRSAPRLARESRLQRKNWGTSPISSGGACAWERHRPWGSWYEISLGRCLPRSSRAQSKCLNRKGTHYY